MKTVPVFLAAALLALPAAGAAIAQTYDSTGHNFSQPGPTFLVAITHPDPMISSARVLDRGRFIGMVHGVAFDDKGHALRVHIALSHGGRMITVNADRFLYDPANNTLTAPKGLKARAT